MHERRPLRVINLEPLARMRGRGRRLVILEHAEHVLVLIRRGADA